MWGLNPIPISWYVSAALAVMVTITTAGWVHTNNVLQRERAYHQQFEQRVKDAQAEANQKAEQKRKELEEKARREAEQADKRYDDLYSKYRANLLRYQASQRSSGGPSDRYLQATEGGDGPGGSPELSEGLIISVHDAEICAVNTARLQAVRDWAIKLE